MLRRYYGKISFLPIESFVGKDGELVIDDVTSRVYVMDGNTPGGIELGIGQGGSLGNLTVNSQTITGTTVNGNIHINPNGTGSLVVGGNVFLGIGDFKIVKKLITRQEVVDEPTILINSDTSSVTLRSANSSNFLHFDRNTGNIGINTELPSHNFDIHADTRVMGIFYSNISQSSRFKASISPSNDGLGYRFYSENDDIGGLEHVAGLGLILESHGNAGILMTNDGHVTFPSNIGGNINPAYGNAYTLGNVTNQWKELWVSSNTIYIGGTPVGITDGALTVNGVPVGTGEGVTMLSPQIGYTGIFNGYPATIPVKKGQGIYITETNAVLETPNKYWLATRFDTNDYDLSGVETLSFNNIGGIDSNFRLGGKSEVLLTDVNLNNIAVITSDVYITDLPALNNFYANNLAYVGGYFEINSLDNANASFNFSNLKTISGTFYYTYNDILENTPQFPALETINTMYIYYNSAQQNTMVFDNLRYMGYASIYQNTGMLSGPEFPALTIMDYFDMNNNDLMTVPPLFPALQTVNSSFYFYDNDIVATAPATPSLVSANYIGWYNNSSMVNGFDFGNLKVVSGTVDINNCALDETSVDYILTILANLDGTNGTTAFSGQTVNLSGGTNSTPSATGLAAKAILEGRGCSVYIN